MRGTSPPERLDTAATVAAGILPDGDLTSATAGRHMGGEGEPVKGLKPTFISILAVGLVAGSAVGVAAQPDESAVLEAAVGEAAPLGNEARPLEPGTYVDASFGPLIGFTIDEGWRLVEPDAEDVGFALAHREIPVATLDVTPYDGRFPPQPCFAKGGVGAAGFAAGEPGVDGFVARLSNHPYLTADVAEPVEVAGYAGLQVDVMADLPESCEPRAGIWVVPPYDLLDYNLGDGHRARFLALAVEAATVVVGIDTREEDFDRFVEVAMSVVESMTITPATTDD